MMIRILLVDDEYYIRERLKIILDWEALGFTIVGEAENGAQALERIKDTAPQLLLIDIKMPVMDGLQLAAELYRQYPHILSVILTGFNTFEYARQAIRYGVAGYLLKPINRAELLEQLDIVKKRLQDVECNRSNLILAEETLTDDLLNHLIFEAAPLPEPLAERCDRLYRETAGHTVTVALFRLSELRINRSLKHSLYEVIGTAFSTGAYFVFHATDSTVGLLLCPADVGRLPSVLSRLYNALSGQLPLASSFGVSDTFPALSGIEEAYRQAMFALQESVFCEKDILRYSEAMAGYGKEGMPLQALRGQLLMELRSCKPEEAVRIVRAQFDLLVAEYRSYSNLSLLVYELLRAVAIYSEDTPLLQTGSSLHIQKFLEGFSRLPEIMQWVIDALRTQYELKNKKKVPAQYQTVQRAKAIIDQAYSDPDCGLEFVATRTGCNANYLSGLFKRVTGISVVQYITNCRMEDAKALIQVRYGTLSDICEKVGYNDVSYFSKRFKQHFGAAPSSFSTAAVTGAHAFSQRPHDD